MGQTKLERLGNFLLVTDINSGTETRFPCKDIHYAFEEKDTVVAIVWEIEGSDIVHRYNIADLIDSEDASYTSLSLDNFLSTLPILSEVIGPITDAQLRATAVPISPRPNTTGANGTTPYKLISLATTNANVVKNTGGNLYSIVAIGLTSTVRFLKFYNKATAPTVGTDVPIMTIPVPANTQGAGISIPFSMGVNFPLGIAIAITAGSADNDAVAIGAEDVLINLTYA